MDVSTRPLDHYQMTVRPRKDRDNEFYSFRYMLENSYFQRGYEPMTPDKKRVLKQCPKPRITSLTSGSVFFPYHKRYQILKHIAHDIEVKSPMFWNQIAYDDENEGIRLALDIDCTRIMEDREIIVMSKILWQTLKLYFSKFEENPIDIFVAKCGPRLKNERLSVGIHIYCSVKVSIEQAQQIIFGFRKRLNRKVNMDGVEVDGAIYREKSKSLSLRMIFSSKEEKCPICKKQEDLQINCEFCGHTGRVISKHTYQPLLCINPEGQIDGEYFKSKHDSYLSIIANYSLWPDEKDERDDYKKPDSDPDYNIEREFVKALKTGSIDKTGAKKKRGPKRKLNDVTSPEIYEQLEAFLHGLRYTGKLYWEGIEVTNVSVTDGNRVAYVNVAGLGSCYCPYAQKDHGSGRISFQIRSTGKMTVYCFSEKVEYGCKTKKRIQFEVPEKIILSIFNIKGPPSLYKRTFKRGKNVDMAEFTSRQSGLRLNNKKAQNSQRDRNKYLKTLTDFYENK